MLLRLRRRVRSGVALGANWRRGATRQGGCGCSGGDWSGVR
jgi:hypothetical protein